MRVVCDNLIFSHIYLMSMVCENEHKQIKKYKLERSKRFRISVVLDIHPGNNVDLDMLSELDNKLF